MNYFIFFSKMIDVIVLPFLSRNAQSAMKNNLLVIAAAPVFLNDSSTNFCCMRLLNSAVNHHSHPPLIPCHFLSLYPFLPPLPFLASPCLLSQPLHLDLTVVTGLSPSAKPLKSSSRMRRTPMNGGYESFSFDWMMLEERVRWRPHPSRQTFDWQGRMCVACNKI